MYRDFNADRCHGTEQPLEGPFRTKIHGDATPAPPDPAPTGSIMKLAADLEIHNAVNLMIDGDSQRGSRRGTPRGDAARGRRAGTPRGEAARAGLR